MYVLLGNGVNLNGKNKSDFTNESIAQRFADSLLRHQRILEELFYIGLENEIDTITKLRKNENIEHIVERLYNFIAKQYLSKINKGSLPIAVHHRILDMITIIGLDSIFFKNRQINYPDIPDEILNRLKDTNKVFTLNYFEYWDKKDKCIYLHGKYEPKINNPNGTILCDMCRLNILPKYRDLVDPSTILSKVDTVHKLVMAPISVDKHKIKVLFPGSNTIPDVDLILGDFLYKELEEYINTINDANESLHIFGMSPYGDKGIINHITNINNIVIYVFDRKNNSQQETDWRELLPNANFRESTEFYI
jgi:hypothetical protein